MKIPFYSVSVLVPIIPLNDRIGRTELALGTHAKPVGPDTITKIARPDVELGDCVIWDTRLIHRGMPNHTDQPRPVIILNYSRHWWKDSVNFAKQPRLIISPETVKALPDSPRRLVSWTLEPWVQFC